MQQTAPLSPLGRSVAHWAREMLAEAYLAPRTVTKYEAILGQFAELLAARGILEFAHADRSAVQAMLGHRSLTTTAAYLKADDAWMRQVHASCHPLNKPTEGNQG